MQNFEVRGERRSDRVRVHASGELDVATVPHLEACARERIQARAEAVELDLREIEFIDSTGVRLLLTLAADAQRDGWTLTILPSDAVRHIVSLLGLEDRLLPPLPADLCTVEAPTPTGSGLSYQYEESRQGLASPCAARYSTSGAHSR